MRPESPATAGTASAEAARFLADVRAGLSARPKRIPCRWLYDAEGSRLFEAIMALPEYYLTRCETRILEIHKDGILEALRASDPGDGAAAGGRGGRRHVVDLGAGNGAKTRILLRHFRERGSLGCYLPVDVCPEPLQALALSLGRGLPGLPVRPLVGDWLEVLDGLDAGFPGPKLALFLGSNIGNHDRRSAIGFLSGLRARLSPRDALLVGFDLRKEPARVLRAYSDTAGVTARFNLNLLDRINRELGGTFRREDFLHRATYEEGPGEARSHLVARRALDATLGVDGFRAAFAAGEAIHTESSYKYSPEEIGSLAREAGFLVAAHFTDPEGAFLDSLWRPDPGALRPDPPVAESGSQADWTAGGSRGP
jgi:dimethylhistidine N-methyltransferase